jgi:hypothetical protein
MMFFCCIINVYKFGFKQMQLQNGMEEPLVDQMQVVESLQLTFVVKDALMCALSS